MFNPILIIRPKNGNGPLACLRPTMSTYNYSHYIMVQLQVSKLKSVRTALKLIMKFKNTFIQTFVIISYHYIYMLHQNPKPTL